MEGQLTISTGIFVCLANRSNADVHSFTCSTSQGN